MEHTKKTIEILNDLILINNDRIIGYEHAIEELKGNGFVADALKRSHQPDAVVAPVAH